jgi:O-antigen ligase
MFYIGCYYPTLLKYVKIGYVVLFIGVVSSILKNKKILYTNFIFISILFISYSFLSVLWAENVSLTLNSTILLLKASLITIAFSQLISNGNDFKWALLWLFLSGLFFGIVYIAHVNIAFLGNNRINNVLEVNVNIVAMYISFAAVYFLYKTLNSKLLSTNSVLFLVSFIILIVLGSRKSILTVILGILMFFTKLNLKSKINIFFLISLFILLIISIIPREYLAFVLERGLNLNVFSENTIDYSDQLRLNFIDYGISYFLQNPIFGHGFYNFSILYENSTGIFMYSHNNFIETLVGGGLIAFIIYYSFYIKIFNQIKDRKNNFVFDYRYLLLVLFMLLLFNHIAIVVLIDRFIWLLLALLFIGTYKKDFLGYQQG